jgi:hypothetical protein
MYYISTYFLIVSKSSKRIFRFIMANVIETDFFLNGFQLYLLSESTVLSILESF